MFWKNTPTRGRTSEVGVISRWFTDTAPGSEERGEPLRLMANPIAIVHRSQETARVKTRKRSDLVFSTNPSTERGCPRGADAGLALGAGGTGAEDHDQAQGQGNSPGQR